MCIFHSHCSVNICFIYSDSSTVLMSHSVSSQNIRIFSSRMWWHKQFVLNLTKTTRMTGSCYPNFCARVNKPTKWHYREINETQRNVSSSCQDSQKRQTLRVRAGNLLRLLSVGMFRFVLIHGNTEKYVGLSVQTEISWYYDISCTDIPVTRKLEPSDIQTVSPLHHGG